MKHESARFLASDALITVFGADTAVQLGLHAVRHLAGIGWLETRYGNGWSGAGVGSNNIGAIQAGSSWAGDTFEYTDTRPNPDGSSTPYRVRFRKYPTLEAGWRDLARVAYAGSRHCVRVAAERGDTYSVSQYLHETRYYEGFGGTIAERRWHHFIALRKALWVADVEVGIEVPRQDLAIPSTVRYGSTGETVVRLQKELRVQADGIFGPLTDHAVRTYQRGAHLLVDGVVGPATWTALLTDGFTPAE